MPALLSSQGRGLAFIAQNPGCTVNLMAGRMYLTRRTIWGIIGSLKRARLIYSRKREGSRELLYFVRDPAVEVQTVRFMEAIAQAQ